MTQMRRVLVARITSSLVVCVTCAFSLVYPARMQAQEAGDPAAGKEIFLASKCNLCHAVPAAEIEAKTKSEKLRGADLGGPIEASFDAVAAYLRKQGDLDGKQHKKEFKGTDEEIQAIVDWLASLEVEAPVDGQ